MILLHVCTSKLILACYTLTQAHVPTANKGTGKTKLMDGCE